MTLEVLTVAGVTPFVGVWIETAIVAPNYGAEGSHPSWVCGLKLDISVL